MQLLEPGFTAGGPIAATVGRVRLSTRVDPVVDRAVDDLLAASGLDVVDLVLPGWAAAVRAGGTVLFGEAWLTDHAVYEADAAGLGAETRERLEHGRAIAAADLATARAHARLWRHELAAVFAGIELLALPTLTVLATRLDEPPPDSRITNVPVNLAGLPALALPAPTDGPLPASVQLVGPHGCEPLLLATGARLEAAALTLS